MPRLIVVRTTGAETVIECAAGPSVMQLMLDSGIDLEELPAHCGGCCTCSTCQVWVDPAFHSRLPKASDRENDLLSLSEYRKPTSRLSCQIKMTDALDGLRVTLVPVD